MPNRKKANSPWTQHAHQAYLVHDTPKSLSNTYRYHCLEKQMAKRSPPTFCTTALAQIIWGMPNDCNYIWKSDTKGSRPLRSTL
jgi:hypothetical protein